jgi:Fe-S-cluster containining protein
MLRQSQPADHGPMEFFNAHRLAFGASLSARSGRPDLIDDLLSRAFSSFEVNAAQQSEGSPQPACHKGCSTCCTLRVTATAPEVLMVARAVRHLANKESLQEFELIPRLGQADQATRGLGEEQRVKLRRRCPLLLEACCAIYPVRPLACRAHLSFDKSACIDAARGQLTKVPYSEAYMTVRSLIQNALQSALRTAGLAWANYELNQAVCIALADTYCEQSWLRGVDVFAEAMVDDISLAEMASTYDRINAQLPAG